MRAISLWQPWASAIAIYAKRIETRGWPTSYRGPLAIHAAKTKEHLGTYEVTWSPGEDLAQAALHKGGLVKPEDYPLGAVVAVCRLVGCVRTEILRDQIGEMEKAFGCYDDRRFGWQLEGIQPLKRPLPWRGRQMFFDVPEDLIAEALK